MTDDAQKEEDYNRADRGRAKKVYRIKNPFQRNLEEETIQQESNSGSQDSDAGASNQYAAMQYSLPPEQFLQQMRAENNYYQQQVASVEQTPTPAPNLGYTATPQPQYQYSTIAASGYDNNSQQSNHISQLEPKMVQSQTYRSINNPYHYNGPSSYGFESAQSTPSPLSQYVSTASNSQYIGTPANTYVSSSSPIFLSSTPNLQQYVSSPLAPVPSGVEYNNKVTSTIGNNIINFDSHEKKMQFDHFDISNNGLRYQPQYHNDYPSSTSSPSTPYPDPVRDSWQNAMNSNALQKSLQDAALSQYHKYTYGKTQQESGLDESDTHRIGNLPSANNVYLSFLQPDYQALQNLRSHTRESDQESGQTERYSHGEYGWKLNDKKPQGTQTAYAANNYPYQQRYQSSVLPQEGVAVSQMSFHMDTGKPPNFEHITKSGSENTEAQEFSKAAAKAHENMKRQQYYGSDYSNYNTNPLSGSSVYGNEKQRSKLFENGNTYIYSSAQPDLITASPYAYYSNSKENIVDDKPKQPFDHDKALKNIVPIDVSNVVNSESQQKFPQGLDSGHRYTLQPYSKDVLEQNLRQNFKTITDAFYHDKNAIYGVNIRPKHEEMSSVDGLKFEPNLHFYSKQQEQYYNQNPPTSTNYIPTQTTSYQDSVHSPANIQPQGVLRPQNPTDISSILKLNDIPYRLTQNLPQESFRMNNDYQQQPIELPTPLPLRLNQNVGSHQLDVAAKILNNLVLNKQQQQLIRPEIDSQSNGILSTINGFKVANPYNVDLNLVANMLKGKPTIDESRMIGMREQYAKPTSPLRLDIAQLQHLLFKHESGNPNLSSVGDGLSAYNNQYFDIYGSGRYPYQGVKYSRSQEEEESIVPIADASNNHPIGAVVEQDDPENVREIGPETELTGQEEDHISVTNSLGEERHKIPISVKPKLVERNRHPISIMSGRYPFPRKYTKGGISEPYPLLKPPPRARSIFNKNDKRKRRVKKRPRLVRIIKTEPLFETNIDDQEMPTLLRPPPPIAEAKSDKVVDNDQQSSS